MKPQNKVTITEHLAKAVMQLAGADTVTVAAGVVLVVVIARVGGASELGTYATVMGWFTVLDMVADFGSETHVARSPKHLVDNALHSAIRFRLFSSLLAIAGFLIVPLAVDVPYKFMLLAALWLPLRALSTPLLAHLRVNMRFAEVSRVLTLVGALQFLGGSVVFYLAGMLGLLMWFLVAECIRLLFVVRLTQSDVAGLVKHASQTPLTLRTQAHLAAVSIQSALLSRSGVLALSMTGSMAMTGVYSAAHRVISVARIVPGALYRVLVSVLNTQGAVSARAVILIAFGIGIVGSIAIGLLAEIAIPLLYAERIASQGAVEALQVLSLLFTTQMVIHACESFLVSGHREKTVNSLLAMQVLFISIAFALMAPVVTVQFTAYIIVCADVCTALAMVVSVARQRRAQ